MDKLRLVKSKQRKGNRASSYATVEDFQKFFVVEMASLSRLALLLTAEAEDTERTLILAIGDCFQNGSVSKEWIGSWARRAVIRQAIHVVLGTKSALPETFLNRPQHHFEWNSGQYAMDALAESLAILSLPRLERLVFVVCGIERYRIQDCSLLLNESAETVRDALRRARGRLVDSETLGHSGAVEMAASDVDGERNGSSRFLR